MQKKIANFLKINKNRLKTNNIQNIILFFLLVFFLFLNFRKIHRVSNQFNQENFQVLPANTRNLAGMDAYIDRRNVRIGTKEGTEGELIKLVNIAPRSENLNFTMTIEIQPSLYDKSNLIASNTLSKQVFSVALIEGDLNRSKLYRRDFYGEPLFKEIIIKEIVSQDENETLKEYEIFLRKNIKNRIKNILATYTFNNLDNLRDTVYHENNSPEFDDIVLGENIARSEEILRTTTGKKILEDLKIEFSNDLTEVSKNKSKLDELENILTPLPNKINENSSIIQQITPEKLAQKYVSNFLFSTNKQQTDQNTQQISRLDSSINTISKQIKNNVDTMSTNISRSINNLNQKGNTYVKKDNLRGIIVMWSGSSANLPQGWAICDGTNGTPDLRDRFILGRNFDTEKTTGGSKKITKQNLPPHSHGFNLKTNQSGAHKHTSTYKQNCYKDGGCANIYGRGNYGGGSLTNFETGGSGTHSHNVEGTINNEGNGEDYLPKYYRLAFIMKK